MFSKVLEPVKVGNLLPEKKDSLLLEICHIRLVMFQKGLVQGWNSDFGLDKERKKDFRQGKKIPGKDLRKARKCLSRQNSTKKCVNLWENAQYKSA